MAQNPKRPKFEVIQGEGQQSRRPERIPSIFLRGLEGGKSADPTEPTRPDLKLKFNLAKIKDSSYFRDVKIFSLYQTLVIADEIGLRAREKDHRAYIDVLLKRRPQGMPENLWTIFLEDSLDDLKDIYDYVSEDFFSRARQERLIPIISTKASTRGSRLWDDEDLKERLLESFDLSYRLTSLSAESLGMTAYDLLTIIQKGLIEKGAGLTPYGPMPEAQTTREAVSLQTALHELHEEAWSLMERLLSGDSPQIGA